MNNFPTRFAMAIAPYVAPVVPAYLTFKYMEIHGVHDWVAYAAILFGLLAITINLTTKGKKQ